MAPITHTPTGQSQLRPTHRHEPPPRGRSQTGVDVTFDGGEWANPCAVLDYAAEGIYLITDTGSYFGL